MTDASNIGPSGSGAAREKRRERDARRAHRRQLAAERMRRVRERQREGYRMVNVHNSEVSKLVQRGFLAAGDQDDAEAITDALGRLLDRVLG